MFKHDYAEVSGIRLHYVTNGTGKLILFVHGFPEYWYAWKDQLAEFGTDHLAVAPICVGSTCPMNLRDSIDTATRTTWRTFALSRIISLPVGSSCWSGTTSAAHSGGGSRWRIQTAWRNS